MKHASRIASASLVVGLLSVRAAAQEVGYDVDRTKNFANVRTFAVKAEAKSDNPLVDRRVIAAIVAELAARGLRQVQSDPDVFVVPKMTTEMREQVTAYGSDLWPYYDSYWGPRGAWGGWGWGGWGAWYSGPGWAGATYDVRELQYNTLVIDMIDAKTGNLLWRGKGVKRVHSHWKPAEVDKNVQKTVAKIMGNLPANSRGSLPTTTQ